VVEVRSECFVLELLQGGDGERTVIFNTSGPLIVLELELYMESAP